jgi:hypothetical protein
MKSRLTSVSLVLLYVQPAANDEGSFPVNMKEVGHRPAIFVVYRRVGQQKTLPIVGIGAGDGGCQDLLLFLVSNRILIDGRDSRGRPRSGPSPASHDCGTVARGRRGATCEQGTWAWVCCLYCLVNCKVQSIADLPSVVLVD